MTEKEQLEATPELDEQALTQEEHKEFIARWLERHQTYVVQPQLENQENKEGTPELEVQIAQDPVEVEESEEERLETQDSPALAEAIIMEEVEEEKPTNLVGEKKESPFQGIPTMVWLRSFPILVVAVALLGIAIYFVSPLSKFKEISVAGNSTLTAKEIKQYSLISSKDYAVTTWLHSTTYAKNIENSSPWVKSATIAYQFPNRFTITVEEYAAIGYVKREEVYYPVLSSGTILDQASNDAPLMGQFTTINLQDQDLVKELASQLGTLDSSLLANIQTIDLTPSAATADLLTLTMYDGNKVLVPLSEISEKMVYYPKIAVLLMEASTVDMEVGIFSYSTSAAEIEEEAVNEEGTDEEIITENSY